MQPRALFEAARGESNTAPLASPPARNSLPYRQFTASPKRRAGTRIADRCTMTKRRLRQSPMRRFKFAEITPKHRMIALKCL